MVLSILLLTVQGSEGLYMVNGQPHFTESTLFPRESGKHCKPDAGLDSGTLGSGPELKANTQPPSHPGIPKLGILK
uniref:Uncharacterized protein n=1 Tax=Canis lupus dingo TaxID=286419 RepID=A0A8C0KS22_CANLU